MVMHQYTYGCIAIAAGDHILDVTVRDRCVDGSPFVTKVYDSDQIVIGSIPTQTILGKPVCFGS